MQLGSAVSDIVEMVLRQIERTVKSIERQDRGRLAKASAVRENVDKEEKERKDVHGDHIHETGRVPDTRPDTGRTGDAADRQIRDDAQDVFEKPPEGDVLGSASFREAGQSSGGYRPDGAGAGGTGDGEATHGEPAAGQSERSDGMDGTYEQPQAPGGGSGAGGPDLQLEWHDEKTEDNSLPFFHSSEDVNQILRNTPYLLASKQEIYDFYAAHEDDFERARFIRGIFNHENTELTIDGNRITGYKAYRNVFARLGRQLQ